MNCRLCGFKKEKEAEKVIEEATKPQLIPFLKREKPITDLDSLFKRIEDLKLRIEKSTENIKVYNHKIKCLGSGITYIDIDTEENCMSPVSASDFPEIIETFRQSLLTSLKARIEWEQDMAHTCQDELDWLENKISMSPLRGVNMFESGSFNFNPYTDHS